MHKLVFLFVFFIVMSFLGYKDANAVTISAVPHQPVFGPNDWIKVDLSIKEYNGGPITWVAHRPNSSAISGQIQDIGMGTIVHQIIRDASDNSFGTWSIDYLYNGVKETIQFRVNPIILTVFTDKELYYEPDKMQINITTSYYNPNANLAQLYHLNFFDRKGNPAKEVSQIDISALEPSIVYEFPLLKFSKYNPPGLYKLKVQYYNTIVEAPFLLGDISKLMEVRAQTNLSTYNQSDNVVLDLIFTRVKESTGTLKITDPSGNITNSQFHVESVHTSLILKDITEKIGTYKFEVQYAGVTTTGSFNVVAKTKKIPNIELEILLDKLNYKRDEIIHAKIHTSAVIANSISMWVADPNGTQYSELSVPMTSNDVILPHRIAKNYAVGTWKFYINYGGVIRFESFYVDAAQADNKEMLDTKKFTVPTFSSKFGSTNFTEPNGIAIDSDNNVYVVDSGHSKVMRLDSNGTFALNWGSWGSSNGQFKHPTGIFVNKNYVFVADSGNARIQMFDNSGNFLYAWGIYGMGPSMFHSPVAMALDETGDLFVADSDRDTIQIFSTGGIYKYQIQSPLTKYASFSAIKAITFDSEDHFYAVSIDNRILKYSSIGNFKNFFGSSGEEEGRFNNPTAIVIDSKDNFYVVDSGNHRIQKFDTYGNFILSWGTEGTGPGQFEDPAGIAIDSMGNIYVVDKKNNNVQKFSYTKSDQIATPSWVRDTAMWWSVGVSNNTDFAQGIRFMIRQGLIEAPLATEINAVKIPEWLKSNARWWYSGEIDDRTFAMSIQYLLESGIVKV
ncbi:MAG: 6-bladed beta-propeller [Thaumarchaeota archaeon]|nr:MAG: 6-bladed beta-propeller [Nitrososphaerota archaeon]